MRRSLDERNVRDNCFSVQLPFFVLVKPLANPVEPRLAFQPVVKPFRAAGKTDCRCDKKGELRNNRQEQANAPKQYEEQP